MFSHDQNRVVDNLAQHYDSWVQARRALGHGHLQWKSPHGTGAYLYRVDGKGQGHSLGPRSPETQALYEAHQQARQTLRHTRFALAQDAALYRALKLPRITPYAADVLVALDVEGWLDGGVLAVGTTAMAAYELEAQERFGVGLDATEDFDMTWKSVPPNVDHADLLAVLKQVDQTYTVNTERPFQVRNAAGYEVELLLATSASARYAKTRSSLLPVPLPEQDWLLLGTPVSQVVVGTNQQAARLVAPDPRYFALQKLWLSQKPGRRATKVAKDAEQGRRVLDAVVRRMPHYPLDASFRRGLPAELKSVFRTWELSLPKPATKRIKTGP